MKLLYKISFCSFLLALVVILITGRVDAQMQSVDNRGNFTSFTPEKKYADFAKLTALTPLNYRNHPDFGVPVNDSTEWYEQINKRSLKTRTFIGPGNEIIKESAYDNINYIDENGWIRAANTKLKPSLNGWSAERQEMPVYLYKDASTALSLGNKELMVFNKNVHFNQDGISVSNYTVGDNGMYIKNAAANTDKIIRFGRGSVETDYLIKQPIKLNGDLVISEDIILPGGYTISENANDENKIGWLDVTAPDGKLAAEIRSPFCYDNHYKSSITGSYHIQKQAGGYKLEIQVPSSWLNDSSRQYPVTIDPLITGPTTVWAGGKIPSCLRPHYGSGTILDSVPAGVTITHCYVQGSWWTPIISKKYFTETFVTRCGSFGPVSVSDTTTLPGLAAGIFDAHNPLTCCIKPSCSLDTFSVTMEITRDSGGTDCDSTQYGWYDPVEANAYANEGFYGAFESYVLGRTVQDSALSISPTTICANQCSLNESATVYFGVPPYTLKYVKKDSAWTKDTVSFGTRIGCNIVRGSGTLAINIPNCPLPPCKDDTTLYAPAPTISDACGNVVGGLSPLAFAVKETPNVTATPDTVCSGMNVNLALLSCISSTYTWTGPNGSSGSGSPINDMVNNNGSTDITANFTVTPTGNGCTGSATILPVTITPFTIAVNPSNTTICAGSSATLNASGDATQYSWSPATGLTCTACANPVASPTVTTSYIVSGTNSSDCSALDTVVVVVNPSPSLTVSNDTTIFLGQSAQLFAHSSSSITWSPSTGLSATTGDSVIATPTTTTTYKVSVTEGGCTITEDIIVIVTINVIVPGAFTPGGDKNNTLHILNQGIDLQDFRVYNRWGQMVYEATNINDPGWDGKYNGKPQPMGTYVYYAEVNFEGKTYLSKGNVTLLR